MQHVGLTTFFYMPTVRSIYVGAEGPEDTIVEDVSPKGLPSLLRRLCIEKGAIY